MRTISGQLENSDSTTTTTQRSQVRAVKARCGRADCPKTQMVSDSGKQKLNCTCIHSPPIHFASYNSLARRTAERDSKWISFIHGNLSFLSTNNQIVSGQRKVTTLSYKNLDGANHYWVLLKSMMTFVHAFFKRKDLFFSDCCLCHCLDKGSNLNKTDPEWIHDPAQDSLVWPCGKEKKRTPLPSSGDGPPRELYLDRPQPFSQSFSLPVSQHRV